MLRARLGDVKLAGVNHNITEIQGNGVGNLTFANNFNLTGSINSTGGNAVGLIFEGNNNVTGVVGTATSPVGTLYKSKVLPSLATKFKLLMIRTS